MCQWCGNNMSISIFFKKSRVSHHGHPYPLKYFKNSYQLKFLKTLHVNIGAYLYYTDSLSLIVFHGEDYERNNGV